MHLLRLSFYTLIVVICFSCENREDLVDKSKLTGYDFRLYQSTPVWQLAKAVEDEDVVLIDEILTTDTALMDVDFRDEKFDGTLLHVAVSRGKYKSCKALLKHGADVNALSKNNDTPLYHAIFLDWEKENGKKVVELLLKNGANPNMYRIQKNENTTTGEVSEEHTSILHMASYFTDFYSLERVKMLVKYGANINFKPVKGYSPLYGAMMDKNYKCVLFLLQQGCNYNIVLKTTIDGQERTIYTMLRRDYLSYDTPQHQYKLKVIDFLESREPEFDYHELPIPSRVEKEFKRIYPDNWEEVLQTY